MKKKFLKSFLWATVILVLAGNTIAINQSYRFTHYVSSTVEKTSRPENLSLFEKLNILFLGVKVPRPRITDLPSLDFETVYLNSFEKLEAWEIQIPDSKGIIILFPGYSSSKSWLLPYSHEFNEMGYSTFLVDFMGSGGSSGNTTTIGFKESRDVKEAFDFVLDRHPEEEIVLFGCSMGAVSLMKAINDYQINPSKVILECPFGSMLDTTRKRFEAMKIPSFPVAQILLLYGGIQIGFNPFKHNPSEYAKQIKIPSLLLYGAKDGRVTKAETMEIFQNLSGVKKLKIFEESGHEIYLNNSKEDWVEVISQFLKE